jgi:hypothetical protein
MTSYAYRATTDGTSEEQTVGILRDHGFLWRSAFKDTEQRTRDGVPPLNSYLRQISPVNDELFVYFSDCGTLHYVGAFAFAPVRPAALSHGAAHAVVRVDPRDALHTELQRAGYGTDPFLDVFTGFDVVPLRDGIAPPGIPQFVGQYSIGTFIETPAGGADMPAFKLEPATSAPDPSAAPPTAAGRCWGIDWSGARLAGDKVWLAELDPANKTILEVSRPWAGAVPTGVVDGVARWLSGLDDAWVAFDFPFAMASADQRALVGSATADPRVRGRRVAAGYPTVVDFIAAAAKLALIGRHRRTTDGKSPFAPLLYQLIYQTYWGHRLLAQLPTREVAVLPWEHTAHATVRVVETCPAVLLRTLGESNYRYKLKPGTEVRRLELLDAVTANTGWTCPSRIRDEVARDA